MTLRVHLPNFGVIAVRFAPKACICGGDLSGAVKPTEIKPGPGEKPRPGDLEMCPSCQAFRVWRNQRWHKATTTDLRRQLFAAH